MQCRPLHVRECVANDVLYGHTACIDPAHRPVASMRDSGCFVSEAEVGGKEAVGDEFAIAGARHDHIRLPSPIARARWRAVKQVATMCECSINVHESPAPDCLIDGPFASAMPCVEAVDETAAVMLLYALLHSNQNNTL